MTAVDSVSFDVNAGEVFGLLGPNGAGKTTTLRILATLIEATSGTATVDGLDVRKDAMAVRRKIGVVNGGMGLYDRLKGREILHYFGKLYGMTAAQVEARTEQLDELLNLGATLDRQAGGFSTVAAMPGWAAMMSPSQCVPERPVPNTKILSERGLGWSACFARPRTSFSSSFRRLAGVRFGSASRRSNRYSTASQSRNRRPLSPIALQRQVTNWGFRPLAAC